MILVGLALAGVEAPDPAWGAVLAGLGGCEACHTADDGAPYAGGHAIETPHGTFFGSNLTPDPEHGVGAWTLGDFTRAMRRGRSPDGHAYWPAFPYPSFTGMSDGDLADLWAFLGTLEPVALPDVPHEGAPAGWKRWAWRTLAFHPRGPDPDRSRGAYLVEVVGHCGECHSPRSGIGRVIRRQALEGGSEPFTKAPAIHPEALEDWSDGDLSTFLEMGMLPDGDFPGRGMNRVVQDGIARLSDADRAAMAAFLRGADER